MQRRKILFLIPTLSGGGAERILITLLKYIDKETFDLSLAVVSKGGVFRVEIPHSIRVFELNLGRVRYAFMPLVNLIRRERPDIIFSVLNYLNLLMLMLKRFLPRTSRLIIAEHNVLSESIRDSGQWWTAWLYRLVMDQADAVLCVSDAIRDDMIEHYGANPTNTVRIYNPIDFQYAHSMLSDETISPYPQAANSKNIVTIGRLERQKRHDILIRAFAKFKVNNQNVRLWVLGVGPLLSELKNLCKDLGISDSVFFVGFQNNPYSWLKHADLFALSSMYEGLPLVIIEALACGCPVIAADCPGGVREIMELTGNSQGLMPLNDFHLTADMLDRQNAPNTLKSLIENFSLDKVIAQYEQLLSSL